MEAVEVYEKQLPDLILMDMYMPVMNGFDATRKIKATEAGRNTPVIAVSASVFEEEKPAIFKSGCDDFIGKPIEIEKLFAVIGRHIPVEYEYQEVLSGAQISIVDTAGMKEKFYRLATFLPDKCKELYDALILLDVSRINTVIREIGVHDPELGAKMVAIADSYDYNKLRDLLETCIETKDRQANH